MKNQTFLSALFSALLLSLLMACSNDDNNNQPIHAAKQIEFKLSFSDYNTEDSIEGTRAVSVPAKKEIIPMGNLFAEISVQRDTTRAPKEEQKVMTRVLANGKYRIYAYQGSTQKGMMTGTMAGNTFTPDGGLKGMSLMPGTYTFICVNEKVDVSGSLWTVSRENIETARMGITENVNIAAAPKLQQVTFNMKHVGCRVRMRVSTEGYYTSALTTTLASVNNIPQQATFNPATRTFTYGNTAAYSQSIVPNSSPVPYQYFFPGTKISDLKYTLNSGTVYKLPVSGRYWTFPGQPTMTLNGAYVLNITLKYNYIYLYSDGTTGQYTDADFTSHTPVAMVVSRGKRLAIALKDANMGTISWSDALTKSQNTGNTTFNDYLNDFRGEDYTWSATYSTDGLIKGNEQTKYPPFYIAAHYDPGVTLTGGIANAKWFLPSIGEWNLYFKNLMLSNDDLKVGGAGYLWRPDEYGFARGGGLPLGSIVSIGGDNAYYTFYVSSSEINFSSYYGMGRYRKEGASTASPGLYYNDNYLIPVLSLTKAGGVGPFTTYVVRAFIHY